ncbi:hypothetical protein A5791_11360 [Mycobacterium sp. 852002-51163_SCH5372311]|uniref:hypothetical protein n=1 Tax=Mycobacterium sp. 852002-51163_SCH5372311 TaxID=1834097 RepID=UPI0007FEF986|nr:hypothetical protein [Mycobacterium sp. 852002-51163_SCH5372311]OBF79467.1 hypothetical protein A5791_11360 [Mycobacterium sp. 852002-51163_SCH5372311]
MPKLRFLTAALISATLMAACASGKTTGAAESSATGHPTIGTGGPAPVAALNSRQCAEVDDASVDLLAGSDADGARRAANTIESFNPPPPAKTAIEYFVSAGGAHFDDPDYPKNYQVLDEWLKQICPTQ